jgi:hypothetical protein
MPRFLRARDQADLLPWFIARKPEGWQSKDPENDPNGYLDNEPYTYQDLVRRGVEHVEGATADQHFRGRVWYGVGHQLFHDVSRRVKGGSAALSRNITIASAYSPKTAWGNNIQQAIHFLLNYDDDPAKRHDWQSANIHPEALRRFREKYGRNPGQHPELDIARLANAHRLSPHSKRHMPGFENLGESDHYAEWADNIRTRGWDRVLDRHDRQVKAAHAQTVKNEKGEPIFQTDEAGQPVLGPRGQPMTQRKKYNPESMMGHVGVPTLGENIGKAKRVWSFKGDWKQLLGDLKTRSFHDNLADDTPMREARTWAQAHKDVMNFNPGLDEKDSPYYHQAHDSELAHQTMPDDEGYYEMPIDPQTGLPNWKLSKDLKTTCDTQHSRAMTMDHGSWQKTKYEAPPALANGPGYQMFSQAVYDSTHLLNSKQLDPGKHLLPKQVQAIVWGKHKDENDYFGKMLNLTKQGVEKFVAPIRKAPSLKGKLGPDAHPHYTDDWNDSGQTPVRIVRQRGQEPQVIEDPMDIGRRGPADWENSVNYQPEADDAHGPVKSFNDRVKEMRSRSMMSRLASMLLEGETGDQFWERMLNTWIARRYPHRVHPSWLQHTTDHQVQAALAAIAEADRLTRRHTALLDSVQAALDFSASVEKVSVPEYLDPDKPWNEQPEWGHEVWEHVMRNPDGMTFKHHPGDGPDDGYMVSLPRDQVERKIPFYMALPEDFHDYGMDYRDEINKPGNGMGGWKYGPDYYLDVSHNHDDSWPAAHSAIENDQTGVYDLSSPDYNPPERTRYVDTSQFLHDQIAKGGSRNARDQ